MCKYSADDHAGDRGAGPPPTPENIALFCLTSTNHRHRHFAAQALRFHAADIDETWQPAEHQAAALIDDTYGAIDQITASSGKLDARFMMYLKSLLSG